MKWLEIIELRSALHTNDDLHHALHDLIQEIRQDRKNPKILIYKSNSVPGDYSIHLVHKQHKPNITGSTLGMRVAELLRTYGLVNHHVWCEMDFNNNLVKELL